MAKVNTIDIDGEQWDIEDANLTASFEQFLQERETQRDYSTTEIDTGRKWIDGKPIYRVVKHVWEGSTTTANYTYNSSDRTYRGPFTTNAETIVDISALYRIWNGAFYSWMRQYGGGWDVPSNITWRADNIVYNSVSNISSADLKVYIIIEYTKTTD